MINLIEGTIVKFIGKNNYSLSFSYQSGCFIVYSMIIIVEKKSMARNFQLRVFECLDVFCRAQTYFHIVANWFYCFVSYFQEKKQSFWRKYSFRKKILSIIIAIEWEKPTKQKKMATVSNLFYSSSFRFSLVFAQC